MSDMNIEKIEKSLQLILNKSHNTPEKKVMRIKDFGTKPLIEMACPICGDSDKLMNKKRGNLFLNNMFYVCFNCGIKMGYIDLLDRFGINIDLDEKMKIYNHIDNNSIKVSTNNENDLSRLDKILDLNFVVETYNNRKDEILDFKPVEKNSLVYKYLKQDRKISNFDNIYEGILKITDKWFEPVLIILNRNKNNLLGFQVRNLKKDKNKRIYKIYDFQKIYNYVYDDDPISNEEALPYNKLSHFYNILNVDFYDKITIFEGYLDSVFYPNSIGTTGVDTDYSFLLNNDELDIEFFYDNDYSGNKKSIEKLKNGYNVFLWDRLFKTLSKGDTKKEYLLKKNIKDLNDIAKISKYDNIYEQYKLNEYFSVDKFDIIHITSYKKKIKNYLYR